MILFIESVVLCVLFTIMILPMQYKDPLNMIMSYPPEIIKRVESLPQYKGKIKKREKAHIVKKIAGVFLFVVVMTAVAYFSGCRNFLSAFVHVFILFFTVNLYDLFVLDWGVFCHSKRLRIQGTEDMEKEYKDYLFHIKGAVIGTILGIIVALLSGALVQGLTVLI